jgi:hypothetical protein
MNMNESFSFNEGRDLVLRFERLLFENGIVIEPKSDLKNKYWSVFEVLFRFEQHKKPGDSEDNRSLFRDFSALYDLALKVISVKEHDDFRQLLPHLRKLNKCNAAQNSPIPITDQDANKIIELYLAAICMRIGTNVYLDDPDNSKGNNPDVIASLNGRRWGFACKTIHTNNSQTIFENIEKAINQIEKSDAEIGIPVINIKNKLPHDQIWPLGKVFSSEKEPLSILKAALGQIQDNLMHDNGLEHILAKFRGKKALPGVIYVAQSVSSVFLSETSSPTPTRLNVMSLQKFNENEFTDSVVEIINSLNLITCNCQLAPNNSLHTRRP